MKRTGGSRASRCATAPGSRAALTRSEGRRSLRSTTDYSYDRGGRPTRLANYHSAWFSCDTSGNEGRRSLRSTNDGKGVTRRLSTAFDYNYDDNGNITEIVQDFVGAEVVTDYAYDEINRLTREVTCDFMNEYYYDDGGNRTKLVHMNAVYSRDGNGRIDSMTAKASVSDQGLTKTYYYANFTELTKMTASEYGGTTRDYTYEHDMAGRLTRQVQNVFSPNSTTTFAYEWDALDRMTKVQKVASGVTKTINYTYNAGGLRVRRVDTSTNVTKLWTYAGNNIASVQTSSGGSYGAEDYVYTVGPAMINNVTERHKLNGTGSDSRYYQFDHRGNVAAVTDSSGKILRGYQYDAFGNQTFTFQQGSSTPPSNDDILFTGKDYDEDTGLYYFNARWYDPQLGGFLSRADFTPDRERNYAYCENKPLRLSDPSGLFAGAGPNGDFRFPVAPPSPPSLVDLLDGPVNCGLVHVRNWSLKLMAWLHTNPNYRDTRGNRRENAMRHCLWQCLLRYWCTPEEAMAVADYHEKGEDPNNPDHIADVHNNIFGLGFGSTATSPLDCYCKCAKSLNSGRLDVR